MKTNRILTIVAATVLLMTSCGSTQRAHSKQRFTFWHRLGAYLVGKGRFCSPCLSYDTAAMGQSDERMV